MSSRKHMLSTVFTFWVGLFHVNRRVSIIDVKTSGHIPENQILSGGPLNDGIPSLFNPKTIPATQADFIVDKGRSNPF